MIYLDDPYLDKVISLINNYKDSLDILIQLSIDLENINIDTFVFEGDDSKWIELSTVHNDEIILAYPDKSGAYILDSRLLPRAHLSKQRIIMNDVDCSIHEYLVEINERLFYYFSNSDITESSMRKLIMNLKNTDFDDSGFKVVHKVSDLTEFLGYLPKGPLTNKYIDTEDPNNISKLLADYEILAFDISGGNSQLFLESRSSHSIYFVNSYGEFHEVDHEILTDCFGTPWEYRDMPEPLYHESEIKICEYNQKLINSTLGDPDLSRVR